MINSMKKTIVCERRSKMNKNLALTSLVFAVMLLSVGMVSAYDNQGTLVGGTVYSDVNKNNSYDMGVDSLIDGANVDVACLHNNVVTHQYDVSHDGGVYGVSFNVNQCTLGDDLSVTATIGEDTKTNNGEVTDHVLKWNVGIVDLAFPLVPEFGVFAAGLTLLSAVGIFFFVRRK
jgi:hypothetical protein